MVVIKWVNRYSNESGYVKNVNNKERHFINTFEEKEAKVYKKLDSAKKIIDKLILFGEGENNNFELITIEEE